MTGVSDYIPAMKQGVRYDLLPIIVVGSKRSEYRASELQQAVTDIYTRATGGTIYLDCETILLDQTLTIPFDAKIRFMGAKFAKGTSGGTIIKANSTMTNLVSITGNSNPTANTDLTHDFHFENITFNGNAKVTNVIKLTNVDTIKFYDCRIVAGTNGLVTAWDSTSDPNSATIPGGIWANNCIFSATTGIALDLQYQTQCWFTNSWFSGSGTTATWINFKSSNKIHIINCEFNTATQAFVFQDTATVSCQDIQILGGTINIGTGNKYWTEQRTNANSKRVAIVGITFSSHESFDQLANEEVPLACFGLKRDRFHAQGNVTGATTFNREDGHTITATLTGNITVTLTNGVKKGETLTLKLTQDGTGNRTVTWPSNFKKAGGSLTLSTGASAVDMITMQWDGTNWNEVSRALNVS